MYQGKTAGFSPLKDDTRCGGLMGAHGGVTRDHPEMPVPQPPDRIGHTSDHGGTNRLSPVALLQSSQSLS
jgi:hypothetical protein